MFIVTSILSVYPLGPSVCRGEEGFTSPPQKEYEYVICVLSDRMLPLRLNLVSFNVFIEIRSLRRDYV